jgi:hypothetical protein
MWSIKVSSLGIMFDHNSSSRMDASWRRPSTCLDLEAEKKIVRKRCVPVTWCMGARKSGLDQAYLHDPVSVLAAFLVRHDIDLKVRFVEKMYRSFSRRWAVIFSSS